jgi:hypothetical protein
MAKYIKTGENYENWKLVRSSCFRCSAWIPSERS